MHLLFIISAAVSLRVLHAHAKLELHLWSAHARFGWSGSRGLWLALADFGWLAGSGWLLDGRSFEVDF